ncbi:UvrD-like helicase family protein [Mariniflexile fucanivorans]|uniref:UvrD-like helicase family protein n=1 Tax=Mariniflexile fucanivorans TaxID=264023 RepID=A0A4R1RS66_9FLAO|nr:AAA family ATPase [Mariniflexile fucanivorans]TCL69303.1 UvrD-like helicase family protein [Mariniflexile fucanivorans]
MKNAITILDHLQFDCPTSEQKSALLGMSDFIKESNNDDFFILCGAAGTGKTSITTALIGYLNTKCIAYNIAAPTGRAARILGRKSKTVNSTIHSLIYNVKSNADTGEVVFELKHNDVKDFNVFIIDEASMISSKPQNEEGNLFKSKNSLLKDLIRFVKSGNSNNKIIFLGDKNQLPPINETESLALSKDYLENNFNLSGSSSLLSEVKRQEDGSCVLKNAVLLKDGIERNQKSVNLFGIKKQSVEDASRSYVLDYMANGQDSIISIGTTHKMNMMFNNSVRSKIYGYKAKAIEMGDLLLITQTWKRNGFQLYSGDHVVVKEFDIDDVETVAGLRFMQVKLVSKNLEGKEEEIDDYLLLDCITNPQGLSLKQENFLRHERFKKNKVYRESLKPWDDKYVGAIRATYGHSITCNKAQGGEWDNVLINSFFMPSLRYQYTAITRAKKKVCFY